MSKSRLAALLAAVVIIGVSSSAYANWMARCQTRSGNGYAEACGTTPIDARARCFAKLPDISPVLLGVNTSNCQP